jgi:DNA-binding NarL/FixJ family response regulator
LLAQGHVPKAAASIAAAVAGAGDNRLARAPLSAAQAEIAIALDDLDLARAAADDVAATAEMFESAGLKAVAQRAQAAVALAANQPVVALSLLRMSLAEWQDLDAPYDAARTRSLLAQAYRALGDDDAADHETALAEAAFTRLGVVGAPPPPDTASLPAGLTQREAEVLRLVAAGKSNQDIAADLFLSPKTVARHVSNIFTKIGVSGRAAATAFAYERGLVSDVHA